ncbi:MAG TPA: SOS response-associated peptidase family protein [Kofleriaceae bacterium]|nr:SOS response-associated peptidase family protein [Kofleriaceae bacterium]
MTRGPRFTLTTLDGAAAFGALPDGAVPRYNIAPGQRALVATAGGIALRRWGLLPRWRGHGGKRAPRIALATLAEAARVPLLRDAERGLALADGRYAWHPAPRWLHPAPPAIVGLAALCAQSRDDGVASFALLHDGDDLLVADRAWLDRQAPLEHAAAPRGWRAVRVSDHAGSPAHDDPRCVAPIGNPRQGELF